MTHNLPRNGITPPLVTPLSGPDQLDVPALERIANRAIDAGVTGLFVLGTTGEGPCVPQPLRREFIQHAVKIANGRILVYANVAENSLADAIASAKDYFAAGADAVAALPPFPATKIARPESLASPIH